MSTADIHARALRRFDSVALPQALMRAQALEDRDFVTREGAMWDGDWGKQYENAPRPEVDKITSGLEKIETDYRENRITVDFRPSSDDADDDTADMLNGVHRADSDHYNASQARDNAFYEGLRGGFGAWRLETDYADPLDEDNDDLRINPGLTINDADQSVYFDGASRHYDHRDAKWAFVITAYPRADAEEEYGEGITPWSEWSKLDQRPGYEWYQPDVVRIAEYYEVQEKSDTLLIFTRQDDEQRLYESDTDDDTVKDRRDTGWKLKKRKITRKRVVKYIMSGSDIIGDPMPLVGERIPIVPFYGRMDYVDSQLYFRGYVKKRKDRQRIYNSSVANVVETMSIAPYPVPIVDPEQMDTVIAEQWARGNIDRLAFRYLKALRQPDGSIAVNGPVGQIEPTQVQPATAALLQVASADLSDDADGADQVKANVSADAMDIAANRVDSRSFPWLDNFRLSVKCDGEIYLGMAREVYADEDRQLDTMNADGKDGVVKVGQTKQTDQGEVKRINDVSRGKYKVVADVQEATSTKRQKTVRQMLALVAQAVPAQAMDLAQAALITAALNIDGEGITELHDYVREKGIGIGLVKPTPEEQQQIQQAQAAQGSGQPSPQDQALLAASSNQVSQAKLADAKAVQTLADAHLKTAQADALGGPEKAPEVPTGLSAANDAAGVADTLASARLKHAQADKLTHDAAIGQHDAGLRRLKTGAEIAQMEKEPTNG